MRLTVLLSLVVALAVTWASLALVRERAVVTQLTVDRALGERFWTDALNRQVAEHNRAIAHARRGELVPLADGPVETDPPPLPEWASEFVTVEPTASGERYVYRSTVGHALAPVPAWFFHGAFAVGLVVLSALAMAEGRALGAP